MRPEARDEFIANVNATAEALGGTTFQGGIDLVRQLLARLTERFDSIQTPELLAKGLDELNVSQEIESLMIQTAASGPLLLRWLYTQFNHSVSETLPTLSSRRPAVKGKTQVEILKFVNDLHFQHRVALEDAKRRAAQRFHCSVRTIERYWREREQILKNGPKLHFSELIEELTNTFKADFEADLGEKRRN